MSKGIKSLKDIFDNEEFSNFRKTVKENDVIVKFNDIFPKLENTVTPSNVHKGVLYIVVDNSVLRTELHMNKKLMIEKINNHFNQQIIVDVKFTNFRNIP